MAKETVFAETAMLIRRPPDEVFKAFTDPEITTQFWFTKSSGKLEAGKHVRWDWEMYGASAQVHVTAIEENKRILFDWGQANDMTTVEIIFSEPIAHTTFVSIRSFGSTLTGDALLRQAIDATGGWTWVLAAVKAFFEHHINLAVVRDRHPEGLTH